MTRRLGLAFGAGLIAALGQAPFDIPLLMLAGLAAAIGLAQGDVRRHWVGMAFGTGYFALTLSWIVEPFLVDIARHGWMAPFALLFMAVGLSLFWGVAFWAGRRVWLLVVCWALAELARAYVLTGFPWAMPSQALVNSIAGQGAAWVGPHGLNLILFAVAGVIAAGVVHRRYLMAGGAAALAVMGLTIPGPSGPVADAAAPVVRLIQPNAAQHEKWKAEMIPVFFRRQVEFTGQGARPDLIVWPETAVPTLLNHAETVLEVIAEAARGAPVVLGLQRTEGDRIFNSLAVLGGDGQVGDVYDKHHLVPFGEYVPLGNLAAKVGISGLAEQDGGGYSAGPGARVLEIEGIGGALPLICYEAVFPQDVNAAAKRPDFLLQITNDAWFGQHLGPFQHLAQARMRAIEQGLPMIRVANTGVSAMIDARGAIMAQIDLGQAGYVDANLPAALPPTFYSKTGDLPVLVLLILLLGGAYRQHFVQTRRR